jgi:ATP-dependent RNA helicase RhlB
VSDKTLTDVVFESFDLHPSLLQGLNEAGFLRCTPIQAMSLPLTLAGKDVAGQAQTGTGKTAAFLVALYNRLLTGPAHPERRAHDPRAVILAPTRELAIQIDKDAQQIGRHTGLRLALIYGGVDYDKQRKLLEDGVDIIIATPGRLIDFLRQQAVSFRAVEMMIMDEADRMFDLGFIKDIRFLLRRMPGASERQNLLFSATLSHRVLELAYEHMNEPEKLVIETETITAARVRQLVYFPATEEKLPLLLGLLARMDANRSMVFVNTKMGCERVARTLERAGYKVGVLSGDVPQKKRETLLGLFVKGELSLLVATDVAARGLHIPGVSHVFNYDLPFDAEDYVHRIGRTARLGAEGDALSFACDEYAMSLPDIEAFIEQKIPVAAYDATLLLPLPRSAPKPTGDGAAAPSLIEDALADAAAERKKRRERDQRDGKRSGGGRSGTGSSPSRSSGPGGRSGSSSGGGRGPERSRSGEPRRDSAGTAQAQRDPAAVRPPAAASAPATAAVAGAEAGTERTRKRRRRPRGERRIDSNEAGANVANNAATPADAPLPLLTRIKQKLKSWMQRLPTPGKRH